jgi:HD-like signal output (HDOD) protein
MDSLSFDLPGISPVGLDLISMLNSPHVTVKQIAAQARLDPVVFGNIVACANSPLYHEVNKTTDILTSLVRLGQREIKRVVYQVVLRSAFYHESAEVNAILRHVWHQSLTSSVFMQKFVSEVPEAYDLSGEGLEYVECLGLLHNSGYVVLLVNFQERFQEFFPDNADRDLPGFFEAEREWFDGHDHFSAGAAVLEAWGFPSGLSGIVGAYSTGGQVFDAPFSALYSLLRLSRHVIMMTDSNFHPRKPADYWLEGTEIPVVEVDYDQIIGDVRDSVRSIEASFS